MPGAFNESVHPNRRDMFSRPIPSGGLSSKMSEPLQKQLLVERKGKERRCHLGFKFHDHSGNSEFAEGAVNA